MNMGNHYEYWKSESQISKGADRGTIENFKRQVVDRKGYKPWNLYISCVAGAWLLLIYVISAFS